MVFCLAKKKILCINSMFAVQKKNRPHFFLVSVPPLFVLGSHRKRERERERLWEDKLKFLIAIWFSSNCEDISSNSFISFTTVLIEWSKYKSKPKSFAFFFFCSKLNLQCGQNLCFEGEWTTKKNEMLGLQ